MDGDVVEDADQSTTTREGDVGAKSSVANAVTEEIARQLGAAPNQKVRRVVVEFE